MRNLQKTIATVCGIGYAGNGSGTVASVAYCAIFLLVPAKSGVLWQLPVLLFILAAGIWSAGALEKIWGHDNKKIVIDEVAGMMITLFLIPVELKYVATGLLLFRFFDIVKPLGIRKAEQLAGGWGVMADDVLAGLCAQLILRLIIASEFF